MGNKKKRVARAGGDAAPSESPATIQVWRTGQWQTAPMEEVQTGERFRSVRSDGSLVADPATGESEMLAERVEPGVVVGLRLGVPVSPAPDPDEAEPAIPFYVVLLRYPHNGLPEVLEASLQRGWHAEPTHAAAEESARQLQKFCALHPDLFPDVQGVGIVEVRSPEEILRRIALAPEDMRPTGFWHAVRYLVGGKFQGSFSPFEALGFGSVLPEADPGATSAFHTGG